MLRQSIRYLSHQPLLCVSTAPPINGPTKSTEKKVSTDFIMTETFSEGKENISNVIRTELRSIGS